MAQVPAVWMCCWCWVLQNVLYTSSPNLFLASGTGFMEENFFMDYRRGCFSHMDGALVWSCHWSIPGTRRESLPLLQRLVGGCPVSASSVFCGITWHTCMPGFPLSYGNNSVASKCLCLFSYCWLDKSNEMDCRFYPPFSFWILTPSQKWGILYLVLF